MFSYNHTSSLQKCVTTFSEHCNSIAKFGYCHDVLSVVCMSLTQIYCDKRTEAIDHAVFKLAQK